LVLLEQPDVSLKVIEFLCARLRRTNVQVQDVMFLNAPARLAKTPLQLADNREHRAKIT
jgi:CRP-like cAMP-binding protein